MFKDIYLSQTWLEEMVYNLLKHHEYQHPEDINLNEICRTFQVDIWVKEGRSRTFPHPIKPGWHVIQVDSQLSNIDQREKIAHELGHLILHIGVQPRLPELMIDLQEHQTNHFVGHLLVPFYMFDGLTQFMNCYNAVDYISTRFRVSKQTAKNRYDKFVSRVYKTHPYLLA